jgi:two-component system chemotaxis response regulator CheY
MAEVARALEPLAVAPAPPDKTVDFDPASKPNTAGMTVLLVEPSRTQAVIIRNYLQELGFQDITTTSSGQKALEMARNAPPRVVISAMHLADMTGVQLARRMRAEAPLASAGFVLITSQGDLQEANLLSQEEHTVRLPKPFDRDRLAEALAVVSGGPRQELESRLQTANAGTPTRLRVLVVDDSAAARSHIRGVLAGLGLCHIVEATDGAQAVTLLEKEAFDLVVTDYNMPRLDGRGLIEFIRHRSPVPSVPVIVVTTETDPARLEAVRQLGVSAICDKSFKPEVVRAVLEWLR